MKSVNQNHERSNCQLPTANCQLATGNCQLATTNCRLATGNWQLPTSFHALIILSFAYFSKSCFDPIAAKNTVAFRLAPLPSTSVIFPTPKR